MLPKNIRFSLRQHPEFFSQSKRYYSALFTIFYQNSDRFEAAVLVSKKLAKKATDRSRLKRIFTQALTEVIRERPDTMPNAQTVFALRSKILTTSTDELKRSLARALEEVLA